MRSKPLSILSLIVLSANLLSVASYLRGQGTAETFQANDAIESIKVDLVVGAGGEDLDEPIALDLGLGFPLWLHRLGDDEMWTVPFGAISQVGTDTHAVAAGGHATFEFTSRPQPTGLDNLQTTSQLLAGVRVSDISRIGFTSKADHGWILESYSIAINGKLFYKNDSVNANGRGCQDQARERLMELNREPTSDPTEINDLKALIAAGLALDTDRARLKELEAQHAAPMGEAENLERQLRGASPFFTDSGFQSAWRNNSLIQRVKVTVVTAPHTGASTREYVYFRTGGHKYLLGSAVNPLAPDLGPQEFTLDLRTAPLAASDLRGYALGVLAPQVPMGDTPDRWHPQRLRVDVDDRVVYDSEDVSLDRASLSAVRLIPPAHLNYEGQVVRNTPIARETFVWEAGSGAGLDLIHGGAEALPAESDPSYPNAEPDVIVNQDIDIVQQQDTWYDPMAEPFPGEMGYGPGWQSEWYPGAGWLPDWRYGWNEGWGPGGVSSPDWFDLLLLGLLLSHESLPDWVIPTPVGEPPQLEQVNVDYATQTIQWAVTGDASQIDHFVVDRVLIRPDQDIPIVEVLGDPLTVPAGQRSLAWTELLPLMPTWTADEASRSYMSYRVTMVPVDTTLGVDPGLSPAVPVRPINPTQSFHVQDDFEYKPFGGLPQHLPLSAGGEPELAGPAVWRAGETVTHNGIDFAGLSPLQHHIVARAQNDGDETTVEVFGILPPGQYRVIAFGGFVGGVEHPVAAQLSSVVHLQSIADPTLQIGVPAGVKVLDADPNAAPTALVPVIHDLNTASVGPGAMSYRATYTFHHTSVDPEHPPALIGLRVLGM